MWLSIPLILLACYAVAKTLCGLDVQNAPHRESAEGLASDLSTYMRSKVVHTVFASAQTAKDHMFKQTRPGTVPDAGRKEKRNQSYSAY